MGIIFRYSLLTSSKLMAVGFALGEWQICGCVVKPEFNARIVILEIALGSTQPVTALFSWGGKWAQNLGSRLKVRPL